MTGASNQEPEPCGMQRGICGVKGPVAGSGTVTGGAA